MRWRTARLVLMWCMMQAICWPVAAQEKAEPRPKAIAIVEVEGAGVVRLPAEGARLFVSLRIRMPTLKEAAAQEERMAARLEEAWKQWKTGTLQWRLLDQQLQALRQPDPNFPEADISEIPVTGYVAWRVYQLEITGLAVRDLQEAVRELQKLALQQGATPGMLPRPTVLGNIAVPNVVRVVEPDLAQAREVVYFMKDTETAYREALKKAQANALAKVQALAGNRSPTRMTVQELGSEFLSRNVSNIAEELILAQLGFGSDPVGRGSERISSTPEIEIIARVKVVSEF